MTGKLRASASGRFMRVLIISLQWRHMISRIEGQLVEVRGGGGVISLRAQSGITYDILIPVCDELHWRDREGETVHLHTFDYLESQGQGNTFLPRLIGFVRAADREFFMLFTKVKGIGYRKALRAMAMPPVALAEAIASRDVAMLKTLPEIGKRTAETIVAELHDKVEPFLPGPGSGFDAERSGRADSTSEVKAGGPSTTGGGGEVEAGRASSSRHGMARDAIAVLVQLGENRMSAKQWIDRALADHEKIESVEEMVNLAFRYRE